MAGSGTRRGRYLGEINVVPLVDVVLVLLIIFMIAAPMMVQGLSVKLPEAQSGPLRSGNDVVVVTVNRDGKIFLNDKPVELDQLGSALSQIAQANPSSKVYLRGDQDVAYGVVVRVLAETRKSGITSLGIVTEPLPGNSGRKHP